MPNLKGWEIVIILALLLLLFGAKRLPDAARGLGRSLRIFKAETKGLRDDEERKASSDSTPTPTREIEGTTPNREPVVPRSAEHETRER